MEGTGGRTRHRLRVGARTAVATLVVGAGLLGGAFPQHADATLPGSVFNGADSSPTTDLAAGALMLPDPVGNIDVTNYTGSNENDPCPKLAVGTAAPKDDLDAFYVGSHTNASGVFMYLGWRRVATTGSATIDFEVNRSPGPAANCNGVNPARSDGDALITYDFHGSGPYTLDLSKRTWDAAAAAWGDEQPLPPSAYEASISANGSFGEMVVNLAGSGLLSTSGCDSFTSVFPKARSSSNSFTAAIKEYVAPHKITASNCGWVNVHKQDDTAAPLSGVTFQLHADTANSPGAPIAPALTCTSNATGDCTIGNVPPGTYWVVEQAAPTGHTGAPAQKVTVGLTANVPPGTLTFVNNRKPAQVDIVKRDDAGALLAGAGFGLFTDNAGAQGTVVAGKTCTTAADGTCSITGILPAGTYWVAETAVPEGYTGAAAQQVTLGLDQTATLHFVNTRKPATVEIVKKDDAGALLAGAAFGLHADNAGEPGAAVAGKTCTTGAAGTCSITGILPTGTYWVVETATPAGHTTAAAQQVTLGLNQTATLHFVNTRLPARVDIVKTDDSGAALAAATFGLFADNAGAKGAAVSGKSCTTSSGGTCSIPNILPPGTYWVSETATPAGYSGAPDQQVVLALNQTVELGFVNTRQPARVDIVKTDDAGARLSGAGFTLHADDAGLVGAAVPGKSCTTSASGTCSITNVLPAGAYWVVESTTPPGHAGADAQQVTLGLNQAVELTFVNTRKPATVNIVKEDDAGVRLTGAAFALFTDDAGSQGSAVPGKTCTTAADGTCSVTGILPPGTYWVVETTTPAGHTGAPAQKATLALDQTVTLTFVNARKPATVNVVKTDDTGAALPGAGFTLHADEAGQVGAAVLGKACTTAAAGTCSITEILPPGTYWVVETTTPAGHTGATAQKATLALDQTVTLTFVNNRKPATVRIVKTDDAGAALAGVAFGLYGDDSGTRGAAVSGKACTTGADGKCSITEILPAGTYWVHEESAPSGHAAAADQKVVLGLDQTVTVEFVNDRRPARVDIVKKNEAGALLAGAGFTLHTDDAGQAGTAVSGKACVTGVAGTCSIDGILPPGVYWVVETATPAGHDGAAPQQVTLALDQSVELTFVNVRKSLGVSITKTANGAERTEAEPLYTHSGDKVVYGIVVQNTGGLPLTITALTDSLKADLASSCDSPAGGVLAVGGSFECEYSSRPTDDEHNVASVTGTDAFGRTTTSSADSYVVPLHPAVTIDKSVNITEVAVGSTAVYTYLVTNTGDTALTDVSVHDNVLGHIGSVEQLDPGRTHTLTASMLVQEASPTTNVAVVKGTDRLDKTVEARDEQTISIVAGNTFVRPSIVEIGELPRTGADAWGWLRGALGLVGLGLAMLAAAGRRPRRAAQSVSD